MFGCWNFLFQATSLLILQSTQTQGQKPTFYTNTTYKLYKL